jgi:5'-3' exonuclease
MADWLLVDGSSLVFRAFFGVPQTMRGPDGRLVNAVRGFVDMLSRVVGSRRPAHLAIADDADWRPAWRVDLIPTYKEHRTAEPVPPLLIPQLPLVAEVLAAIGIDFVGIRDLEAEDVISGWVREIEGSVEILSGDRDLFGLVDDRVSVLYPERGGLATIDGAEIQRRYGVGAGSYWDLAVLRGDPSDGLPGLSGVGPKRAAALLHQYGDLNGFMAHGRLSDRDRDYLRRASQVVRPPVNVTVPLPPGRRDHYPADPDALSSCTARLGLASAADRLIHALGSLS